MTAVGMRTKYLNCPTVSGGKNLTDFTVACYKRYTLFLIKAQAEKYLIYMTFPSNKHVSPLKSVQSTNRKEKWVKHLIGLVLTARGEKKMDLGWCPIVLSVCWPSAEGGNGVRQLSIYRGEQQRRLSGKQLRWQSVRPQDFHQRLLRRGTAWWAVGSSNHKEFILMFGTILRRLFTVSLSVVCITGHKPILTHLSTKPPNHCVWNKQAYETLGNQTAQHCTDALFYHREFAQTTNQLHASSTGLNDRHSGGRWRIVLTSCWHYLTHVSLKAGGQNNECERHKCIKQCRY